MPGPTPGKSPVLPPIPSKHYFTIGEVSSLCAVKPHVLRYWEQEFAQLKPLKRRGNRRYYQPHEVILIRQIRGLLYDQGFTIHGARAILETKPGVRSPGATDPSHPVSEASFVPGEPAPAEKSASPEVVHQAAPAHHIETYSGGIPDSAQVAMATLIGGEQHSPSPTLDLPALKRELRSILELLQTE